ncbi:MAG: hypothetical protein IIA83_08160, partial [Thaumarchaeota archaeon]|nr:hypothetical protein [Nitrososphaerota archaeon]
LLMGTFAATQFPHLVMEAFKDNAGTRIIGNLTESDHQRDMTSSIGLERDDEKILGRLKKGIWVATVAGRTRPFVLKTPEVTKGDVVAEAEVIQRSESLLTEMKMRKQEIESRMFLNKVEKNSDRVSVPELTKEAWLILDYALEHPFNYQGKITKGVGISGRKTREARELLIQKGLIKLEKFAVITYPRIHYILTNKALELLKTLGKEHKKIGFWKYINNGVPSYWHRLFQFYVRSQHEGLGWTGKVEYALEDGRRIDVYEERGGYRKAIELEDSTKDLENKIKVLRDDLADELVLLYKDEMQSRYARTKLMEMKIPEKKILWVGLARDYAKLLNKIIYRTIIAPEKSGNKQKSDNSMPEKNNERKHRGNKEERE